MSERTIRVDVARSEATTNIPQHLIHQPFFIPADQAYYWSREWQEGEAEADADLKAGEYVEFDDPDDPDAVVRWFDEPD